MKKVKSFFGKIFDWIRSNAWIQPLLFVAIIFILILGIRAIGKASQKNSSGCSKKNDQYVKRVLMETVEDYIDEDKNFILYIGRKDCGGCQSIQSTLKGFHKAHPDTTVYYLSLDYTTGADDEVIYKDATITESGLKSLWALIKPFITEEGDMPVTPTIAAFKEGDCKGAKVGGGSAAGITLQDIVDLKDLIA